MRRTRSTIAVTLVAGLVAAPTVAGAAGPADLRAPDTRDRGAAEVVAPAQDLRSPDARETAAGQTTAGDAAGLAAMREHPSLAAPPTGASGTDLRSPDSRDAALDPRIAQAHPAGRFSLVSPQPASPDGFGTGDVIVLAGGALMLVGSSVLVRRRAARAPAASA